MCMCTVYIGIACNFGMRTDLYLIMHCEWFFVRGISKQRSNMQPISTTTAAANVWFSDSALFYYYFSHSISFLAENINKHIGEAIELLRWLLHRTANACYAVCDLVCAVFVNLMFIQFLCSIYTEYLVLFDMGKLTIKQNPMRSYNSSVALDYQETSEER